MTDADQAYAAAEAAIAQAMAEEAESLSLTAMDNATFRALDRLPPGIANLTRLTVLDLTGTRLTSLAPVARLHGLTELRFSDSLVSDLSPVAGLMRLTHLIAW